MRGLNICCIRCWLLLLLEFVLGLRFIFKLKNMSPFVSKSQQRFMFAKHPGIAKRWVGETSDLKGLPEKLWKRKKRAEK